MQYKLFITLLVITSGYAEITEDRLETLKRDIIDAISGKITKLSLSISVVDERVGRWERIFNNKIDRIVIREESRITRMEASIYSVVKNVTFISEEIGSVNNKIEEHSNKIIDSISGGVTDCKETISIGVTAMTTNLSAVDRGISKTLKEIKVGIQNIIPPKNCADLYNSGNKTSGLVKIFPYGHGCHPVPILCDQETDGGRWTIIQKRQRMSPRENFTRPWADYVEGFGKITTAGEYWLGLDHIHQLTLDSKQEIYITLVDFQDKTAYAYYTHFYVGSSDDKYKLTITGYSGDAGDAMTGRHNGQLFSTYDQDNDPHSSTNCAESWKGGWWYGACHHANLNGLPHEGTDGAKHTGIIWKQWKGWEYSLKEVTIMIRPVAA